MGTPQSERLAITAASPRTVTPSSTKILKTPLTDEAIWKRLSEAGFDEESIKRRDKAALISYIAKLEAELYNHQHHMGLLILERKDWHSKYEQIEAAAESAELKYKCEQAAHSSALVEAKRREDNLKKALGVEKECVASIEKALHEMRAECAEVKVATDAKLIEAQNLMEDAQKKSIEAETKLHAAESLEAEASRYHRTAERKLHEVEAREDDLRRHTMSFKSDCDAKEKEIALERKSLSERQKALQQSQERLLEGQALLNQREDHIFSRSQELNKLEKELEMSKSSIEKEYKALSGEKNNLDLKVVSLAAKEQAVSKRECEFNRKEEEFLIQQEKLANKESEIIQKAETTCEASLKTRKAQFEAELKIKRKLVEEEIETKRRAWELREVDFNQREDLILEKEHDLECLSIELSSKEMDIMERLKSFEEKVKSLIAGERELELKKALFEKEKENINYMKLDLKKSLDLLEEREKQIDSAEKKEEAMKNETQELLVLEKRLKEEIDAIAAQKLELEVEADELKAQKAKFETEWELIDEKREELQKEAEQIAEERVTISKFLQDERDSLKMEKDAMRDQYKRNLESLSHDREAFLSEMQHERSEWFSKIQKERSDLLLDAEMQKRELENCIEKRREEIENYLREKEKDFEEEKKKELQCISSLRETLTKEMEQVNAEMERLKKERQEINLDREERDNEWSELNNSINELKVQRQKLENQRELLHADREEILIQIEHLKRLEDQKVIPDRIFSREMQHFDRHGGNRKVSSKRTSKQPAQVESGHRMGVGDSAQDDLSSKDGSHVASPVLSSPLSWLKRCADTLLEERQSHKKRRQQNDTTMTQAEAVDTSRVVPSQKNEPEDEHAVRLLEESPVSAEEMTVYIDKIITVQEITTLKDGRVNGDGQGMPKESVQRLEENGDFKSEDNVGVKQQAEKRKTSA